MNRLAQTHRALALLERAFAAGAFFPPIWEFARGHARALLGEHDAAQAHLAAVLDRAPGLVPARVQQIRVLWETGNHAAAAARVADLAALAPRYDLSAAARMFPWPDATERRRLRDALADAGLS